MNPYIEINVRRIGPGYPVYIIAEMSANHNGVFEKAVEIVRAAKAAGADAVKLQTYTPDTMTIDKRDGCFLIKGTPWDGCSLYELYGQAYTPWDWQPDLKRCADELGMDLFSTPFDTTAVDFLEEMQVPAYKVASFENVDIPLLRKIASTGKPVILSTGMATLKEIEEAVDTLRTSGTPQVALLKCTSAYPAAIEEMNLRTIPHLAGKFNVPSGLSDHTLGTTAAVASVALGACIIEKHMTLSRSMPGPDTAFSLEPHEFKEMVAAVRCVESALGKVSYGSSEREAVSRVFRRSLFVVKDIKKGEKFTGENVRSIRPGFGLHPRYMDRIIAQSAGCDILRGTPLSWNLVEELAS
jgi:pseudaminic acid synthase